MAEKQGWPPEGKEDNRAYTLVAVRNDRVYERTTFNRNAAISAAVTPIRQTMPYNLDGEGITIGLWDAGSPRRTHRELSGRVTVKDGTTTHSHSTHVGGTIGAAGITEMARGMAPKVSIDSYDWNNDESEMAARAMAAADETDKIQFSNHSYGWQAGWHDSRWYGTWGLPEADGFGMYDTYAAEADRISYEAPYYLPFKSAGNDRNDWSPSIGETFSYFLDGDWHNKEYDPATDPPKDGWDNGGYDTIAYDGNAKNIMTVGGVNDAVEGTTRSLAKATMADFSGWGPCDDGRIKPDITANAVSLYSCSSGSDSAYSQLSGTSMSSPNAAGAAVLLAEYYGELFPGQRMRASTLKGLILHTADDLWNSGPDFRFGWGLMNAHAAADHLLAHHTHTNVLRVVENSVTTGKLTNEYSFVWNTGHPVRATLCWTDPPGGTRTNLDDTTPNLVHDLDVRIIAPNGQVFLPFVLDRENPSTPAQAGDNDVDNVEQVYIDNPSDPGTYKLSVTLDGVLSESEQAYSILLSGSVALPEIEHTPLQNTTNTVDPYVITARVTSEETLSPDGIWLLWNTTGSTNAFYRQTMTSLTNSWYQAEVPAHPEGTDVYYYIRAVTANGIVSTEPANVPEEALSFAVTKAVALMITGVPDKIPGVDPNYGVIYYPSGITVRATATEYSPPVDGTRHVCVGWTGFGSVPAMGESNEVSFVMSHDSLLAWQWSLAYSLDQTSSIPGLIDTTTWWLASHTAETVTAVSEAVADDTNYAFAGWYIDGNRFPDDTNAMSNPADTIVMNAPRSALAIHMPETLDADGDLLPDWWESYFFGSTVAVENVDVDGDGFTNIKEFEDGTNPRDESSFPTPPAIAHVPLASIQTSPAPWAVPAVVTDNMSISNVRLEWERNTNTWQGVAMTGSEGNTYTEVIPSPGVAGDSFVYRIVGEDNAGLQAINGPYQLDVQYPAATVEPSSLGFIQLPVSSTREMSLVISNAGNATLNWSLEIDSAGLLDGVETGTNDWTHNGRNDVWHISDDRAYSGTNSWYYGIENAAIYPDNADASLVSPLVSLGTNAALSFRHWLNTETIRDPEHAWDGSKVEISTNDGASFVQITPKGGYPYVMYGHSASAFPSNTPCFAGTGGWEYVEFDLSGYDGKDVRIRFRFGSDGYVVNEGWFIDDISITPNAGDGGWIEISEDSGATAPQTRQNLTIVVSTDEVGPSRTRWAHLLLQSNDPVNPVPRIPIGLHNINRELVASKSGGGSISPLGYLLLTMGDSTNFVMEADPYYHIGDILTNGASLNPADITYTNFIWKDINFIGTGTVHVVFAKDLATNGVPEVWLVAHRLTNNTFDAEAMDDQDGDNVETWKEFVAGTDPTNATSFFTISEMTSFGTNYTEHVFAWSNELTGEEMILTQYLSHVDGYVIEWPSAADREYRLYSATNLWSELTLIEGELPATPPLNTYTDSNKRAIDSTTTRFYRLGVEYAPE